MSHPPRLDSFAALDLASDLQKRIRKLGFTTPTPIQSEAIPVALRGHDLIGIAQTGTGKTLAFGLPMAARLSEGQVGLVLAPTRELALQIEEGLFSLGLKCAVLIGGVAMSRQIQRLRERPPVIVATPGRLLDHLAQRTVDLRRVAIAVLDEADRMLDMGFAPAVHKILDHTPKGRQTMLFSATMPSAVAELAQQYLQEPKRIEIERAGKASENVRHELIVLPHEKKLDMLDLLLQEHTGTVLIFARTRHGARKLARSVRGLGHTAAELHSDRTFNQRKEALEGFKRGQYRILVATDIAARGIDVKAIHLVLNYDLPENPEDYVHRIGRTGRASATGLAITFATPAQQRGVRDIEKLLRTKLPLSQHSELGLTPEPPARPVQPPKPKLKSPFPAKSHAGPKRGPRPGAGRPPSGRPKSAAKRKGRA